MPSIHVFMICDWMLVSSMISYSILLLHYYVCVFILWHESVMSDRVYAVLVSNWGFVLWDTSSSIVYEIDLASEIGCGFRGMGHGILTASTVLDFRRYSKNWEFTKCEDYFPSTNIESQLWDQSPIIRFNLIMWPHTAMDCIIRHQTWKGLLEKRNLRNTNPYPFLVSSLFSKDLFMLDYRICRK